MFFTVLKNAFFKTHLFHMFVQMFNSNYYNPSVDQLAILTLRVYIKIYQWDFMGVHWISMIQIRNSPKS